MLICSCWLRFWESCLTVLLKVQVFSAQSQKLVREIIFSKNNFAIFFLSARWLVIWHTWLKKFAKRRRNHSNSKSDNRKIKLFRKRNLYSSKHFFWTANFCCMYPEENFFTESPLLFHLKVRRRLISCSFFKK